MRVPRQFSLPLLAKELTEQSARRRTFYVRAAYAALLYGVTLWGFYRQIGHLESGSFAMLGTGHILFEQVLSFQMFAVFALLPMLTAGVLTSEKERDTLGLLLITRLGPWTIVLEKFLSRVIPMLLYLLLSLPLMSVAYSLGGVESGAVLGAAALLVGTVLHIGSIGVFASAYCRTTTQALVLTYFVFALYGGAAMLLAIPQVFAARPQGTVGWTVYLSFFAMAGLLPALFWLLLARLCLWRRAFLQPKNWWLNLLKRLDGVFHRLNQNSLTQGIVLLDERVELPKFQPIAWRETMKRSLGTVRYLVRFLILVEGPLLFVLLLALSDHTVWASRENWAIRFSSYAVWWVTVFAVLSHSTALIAGERSRQSLDVLLSTPLSAERIVTEKFAGVQRLIMVLWVPLITVFLFQAWWLASIQNPWQSFNGSAFFAQAVGAAIVYPPLLGWLGLHASLRFKSQVTAMTAALGVTLVLGGLPWAMDWMGVFRPGSGLGEAWTSIATIVLPATGPNVSAWDSADRTFLTTGGRRIAYAGTARALLPLLLLMHFGLYAAIWQWLRWLAPRQFIRQTGRCEQTEWPEPVAIHGLRDKVSMGGGV
ncbi:MAG: ABC transporter permease subunit [Planctomycetaceae bacterium]|nr:ABC transporter permease subunit [Planctomycetaceae bacterium]